MNELNMTWQDGGTILFHTLAGHILCGLVLYCNQWCCRSLWPGDNWQVRIQCTCSGTFEIAPRTSHTSPIRTTCNRFQLSQVLKCNPPFFRRASPPPLDRHTWMAMSSSAAVQRWPCTHGVPRCPPLYLCTSWHIASLEQLHGK